MKTWHLELLFVAALLILPAYLGGWLGFISMFAVLFTFCHVQVSTRLYEADLNRPSPSVHCHEFLSTYLILKELLWVFIFLITGAYPAIIGSVVLLAYPYWRQFYRRYL